MEGSFSGLGCMSEVVIDMILVARDRNNKFISKIIHQSSKTCQVFAFPILFATYTKLTAAGDSDSFDTC